MSGGHLPDDPARWPKDPYRLLGVDRSVDFRSLRRAYVRLIRIYRPEHFPEQFRRIREAYECLEGYVRFRQQCADEPSGEDSEGPHDAAVSGREGERGSDNEPSSPAVSAVSPRAPILSPVEIAWGLAREGKPGEAYRQLRELERQQPGNEDLCLRLYWLLLLHPALEPGRDRRSWLVAGLAAAGLSGPLRELYGRELAGDPAEAGRERCRRLLEPPAPLRERAAFAMHCWPHLGLAGRWDLISQDLVQFREQVAASDVNLWTRMLLVAAEQFRWQTDQTACARLADACHREIEEYSEEHHQLTAELDRGDYLGVLTAELRKLQESRCLPFEMDQQLAAFLRRSWSQPFRMVQEELLALVRPMAEDPLPALEQLDRLYRTSAVVLHQLNLQVQSLYYQRHDFRDDSGQIEACRQAVSTYFGGLGASVYEQLRRKTLLFCLRHRMTIEQLQRASSDFPLSDALTEQWKKDLPLHCLTTACEAFWAAGGDGQDDR